MARSSRQNSRVGVSWCSSLCDGEMASRLPFSSLLMQHYPVAQHKVLHNDDEYSLGRIHSSALQLVTSGWTNLVFGVPFSTHWCGELCSSHSDTTHFLHSSVQDHTNAPAVLSFRYQSCHLVRSNYD
jgi:hypothetical protein